jgi:hypothetical protein
LPVAPQTQVVEFIALGKAKNPFSEIPRAVGPELDVVRVDAVGARGGRRVGYRRAVVRRSGMGVQPGAGRQVDVAVPALFRQGSDQDVLAEQALVFDGQAVWSSGYSRTRGWSIGWSSRAARIAWAWRYGMGR